MPVGPHRVFDGVEFKLKDIKQIRRATPGATINDVMLAVVGGALRAYLLEKNELPESSMIALAPISVRGESEKGQLAGNQVSAMLANLGTEVADPLERVAFVHAEVCKSKALTDAVGARTLVEYSMRAPGALSALGARVSSSLGIASVAQPMYNCVVTNVPGPPIPIYFAGAKLITQYGFAPLLDGVTLAHPIFSYCDGITISFVADRKIMPDPASYAQCLQESFDVLMAAAEKALEVAPAVDRPKRAGRSPTQRSTRSAVLAAR